MVDPSPLALVSSLRMTKIVSMMFLSTMAPPLTCPSFPEEYKRFVALSTPPSKSSKHNTRKDTPERVINTIPKPTGEWGQGAGSGHAGYSIEEESLLDEEELKLLRVWLQNLVLADS